MPGKRIQFGDETWHALDLLARDRMMDFQELADEAFSDLLKKHGRPNDLKTALHESVKKEDSRLRSQPGGETVPDKGPHPQTVELPARHALHDLGAFQFGHHAQHRQRELVFCNAVQAVSYRQGCGG